MPNRRADAVPRMVHGGGGPTPSWVGHRRERPDALLPTMGGQTALNCALDLDRNGVLEKFGVQMIGASKEAIDKAEDREKIEQMIDLWGKKT